MTAEPSISNHAEVKNNKKFKSPALKNLTVAAGYKRWLHMEVRYTVDAFSHIKS